MSEVVDIKPLTLEQSLGAAIQESIDSTIKAIAADKPKRQNVSHSKGNGKGKKGTSAKIAQNPKPQSLMPFTPQQAAIEGVTGAKTLTLGQDTGRKSKKANADGTFSPILSKCYLSRVPSIKELEKDNPGLSSEQLQAKQDEIGIALKDKASASIGSMLSSKSFVVKGFKAAQDKQGLASAVVSFKQIKIHDKVHDLMLLSGKSEEEAREFLGLPPVDETSIEV